MFVSIIIPTLNEEHHLPLLLESVKRQKFNDYEIIIADAGSQDKTREIAKHYSCTIVEGGLPGPGRNRGAARARGDLLLFLDADVALPEGFFENSLRELQERNLQVASFFLVPHHTLSRTFVPRARQRYHWLLFHLFYNVPIVLLGKLLPHAAMGIFIEKTLFQALRGFDEQITMAEDHDLARRASKQARYGIIRSTKLFVSPRRFTKDGWLKTYALYLAVELHMIFKGPVKTKKFQYKFDHYLTKKKKKL